MSNCGVFSTEIYIYTAVFTTSLALIHMLFVQRARDRADFKARPSYLCSFVFCLKLSNTFLQGLEFCIYFHLELRFPAATFLCFQNFLNSRYPALDSVLCKLFPTKTRMWLFKIKRCPASCWILMDVSNEKFAGGHKTYFSFSFFPLWVNRPDFQANLMAWKRRRVWMKLLKRYIHRFLEQERLWCRGTIKK